MIKKLLLIAMLVFSLSGCSGQYEGWKEIELQDYGSIKVPEGWVCHIQNNEIYFVDEGVTEFSEENVHLGGYIRGENIPDAPSNVFPEIMKAENKNISQVYSNNTYRGIRKYFIHENWCEKGYVQLGVSERDIEIFMIAWDDTVSYDDLEKIAKSFDRNLPDENKEHNGK